ncbi:MAG: hypothetical protein AABX12_02925 [Nanoarchaeota archaeon]
MNEILHQKDEDTDGICWLGIENIRALPEGRFRTRDTRQLTELMESILEQRRQFMPLDLVQRL